MVFLGPTSAALKFRSYKFAVCSMQGMRSGLRRHNLLQSLYPACCVCVKRSRSDIHTDVWRL
ncbi:hypothetical protein DPMN_156840 [Dreissena polymorpha]|uniref:Uncharacterized protein n=1 Tax=Dreissena polymorpha TaxID=45954 RepID=A0A9D4FQH3_DREPO|nr:hypothetical protein DPMN_156840 [Dreissena polymorpha]